MKLQKIFWVIWATLISAGVITLVVTTITRQGWSLYTNVTEFFICTGPNPEDGLPSMEIETITEDYAGKIYACGYVETDGRPAMLRIFVEDEQSNLVQASTTGDTGFGPGPFYYRLFVGKRLGLGTYSVYLYKGRNMLAEDHLEVIRK